MNHPRFTRMDIPTFKQSFLEAARRVARTQAEFTSDAVYDEAGFPPDMWAPDSGTVGMLMQQLKHERLAQPTDRVIKSKRTAGKGRAVRIWESTVHDSQRLIAKGQGVLV